MIAKRRRPVVVQVTLSEYEYDDVQMGRYPSSTTTETGASGQSDAEQSLGSRYRWGLLIEDCSNLLTPQRRRSHGVRPRRI